MRDLHKFITADENLVEAARAAQRAARACRDWEQGRTSAAVGDTAATAMSAIERLVMTLREDGELLLSEKDPETRRARLVLAGYMLLLAGTDEYGESADLRLAADMFRRAAIA